MTIFPPSVILEKETFSNYGQMPSLKEGVSGYSVKNPTVLMVRKSSVNKELACDFIKYFSFGKSPAQNMKYSYLLMELKEFAVIFSSGMSPLKEVQEELYQNNQFAKKYIEQLNNAKQIPFFFAVTYFFDNVVV